MANYTVILEGGSPWGFRLQGGKDFDEPVKIAKINPNSKASNQGVRVGDFVDKINGQTTANLCHTEASQLIRGGSQRLELELRRGSIPNISINGGSPQKTGVYNHVNTFSDSEDYPSRSPTPALSYSNAVLSSLPPSISPLGEEEQSGSTSDSQSSVINLSEAGDFSSRNHNNSGSYPQQQGGRNMDFSPSPSPQPSTAVWSPSGQNKVKIYKPISFTSTGETSKQTSQFSSQAFDNQHRSPSIGGSTSTSAPTWSPPSKSGTVDRDFSTSTSHHTPVYSKQSGASPLSPGREFPVRTSILNSNTETNTNVTTHGYSSNIESSPVTKVDHSVSKIDTNNGYFSRSPQFQHSSSLSSSISVEYPNTNQQVTKSNTADQNSDMDMLRSAQMVKNLNIHQDRDYSDHGSNHMDHHGYGAHNGGLQVAPGDSTMDSGIGSPSTASARWTPTITSKTTFSMDTSSRKDEPQFQSSSLPSGDGFSLSHSADSVPLYSKATKTTKTGLWPQDSPSVDAKKSVPVEGGEVPAVWSPTGTLERKGYKSVKLDTNSSRVMSPERTAAKVQSPDRPKDSFDWGHVPISPLTSTRDSNTRHPSNKEQLPGITTATASSTTPTSTSTYTSLPSTTSTSFSSWNGAITSIAESKTRLPQTQSATITLLQKGRDVTENGFEPPENIRTIKVEEGQIPRGAKYLGTKETVDGEQKHTDTYFLVPGETKTEVTKTEVKAPPKFDGIGPVDNSTGMPTGFRSQVDEKSHKDWYKQMYSSLHRTGKEKEEENTYKPTYTFPESEPEPVKEEKNPYKPSYELPSKRDTEDVGYRSLDRNSGMYKSLPTRGQKASWVPADAKYKSETYKNQPRSIEDYEPGKSSIAYKEARLKSKILRRMKPQVRSGRSHSFSEPLHNATTSSDDPENQLYNPPVERPGQFSKYYESDTEVDLIRRRKDRAQSPVTSDVETHQAYKQIQKGGEIPIGGLRYPVTPKKADDINNNESQQRPSSTLPRATTPNASFLEAYKGGFVGSLPRKRNPARRRVSAVEQLGVRSPPPSGRAIDGLMRERSYSQSSAQAHSAPTFTSSSTLDRRQRDEENARRKEQLQKFADEQRLKKYEQEKKEIAARRHKDVYLDEKFKDDNYWLQLAGVADKEETPQTHTKIRQKSPIAVNRFDELDLTAENLERPKKKVNTQVHGKAKALYTFHAQNKRELSFKKGDTMYILGEIDKNWYEGEKHGLRGIFPRNYVEVITTLEEAKARASEREGEARVKYNFTAQTPVELSLKKGDIVTLIRRVDENWYEGRLSNNRQGIFPVNYIEVCEEPETPLMTPLMTPLHSLAPTPIPGSPGQLSPGSTISNGPAPTIPTAPQSPRDLDTFDFNQPFDFGLNAPYNASSQFSSNTLPSKPSYRAQNPSSSASGYPQHGLQAGFIPAGSNMLLNQPQHHKPTADQPYATMDSRSRSSNKENRQPMSSQDLMARSYGGNMADPGMWNNGVYEKASTLDRRNMSSSYDFEKKSQHPAVAMVNGGGGGGGFGSTNRYRSKSMGDSTGQQKQQPTVVKQNFQYPLYKAVYSYVPQNPDELALSEGDRVLVMEQCDDGWFVGTSEKTNAFGTFPGNYVQPL